MTYRILLVVPILMTACREPTPVQVEPPPSLDTHIAEEPAPEIEKPAIKRTKDVCATRGTTESAEVLPSGLWFRNAYTRRAMEKRGLVDPTHAVVAGVDLDVQEARALVRDLPDLPTGYPLVAHVNEIFLQDKSWGTNKQWNGLSVVTGLFRSVEEACTWLDTSSLETGWVVPLLDYDAAYERRRVMYGNDHWPRVVQVVHGPPIEAYPAKAIELAELKHDNPGQYGLEVRPPDPLVEPPVKPLCSIEGGEFSLTSAEDWHLSPYYRWAPVYCGNEPAYVPWLSTTLISATCLTEDGMARMFQLSEVECGVPCFCEWDLDKNGARSFEGKLEDACECPPSCGGGPCS